MAEAPKLHGDTSTVQNYLSLTWLIVDTATKVLRELFVQVLDKPINTYFQKKNVQRAISILSEKGKITFMERDYLLSGNVNAKRFDLSLLYILLSTFFQSIRRPKNGWTNDPDPEDHSTGGDIVRLRNIRNRYIAHSPNSRINEEEYIQLWEEVEGAILRIARTWLPDAEQHYRNDINRIKTGLIVLYVDLDPLYMHPASASLRHSFAHISAEKWKKQKKVSPASPYDALESRIVWSKQESKYTDDTVLPQIYPKLKLQKSHYECGSCPSDAKGNPQKDSSDESSSGQLILEILEKWLEQVSFVSQSFAEGSPLKGTSDDPSSDPLTLILEERLKILQKWQKPDTAYTEETREFILKSCFSCDEPEKEYVSCPSDTEGMLKVQVRKIR